MAELSSDRHKKYMTQLGRKYKHQFQFMKDHRYGDTLRRMRRGGDHEFAKSHGGEDGADGKNDATSVNTGFKGADTDTYGV
jgi:hypothetical protein